MELRKLAAHIEPHARVLCGEFASEKLLHLAVNRGHVAPAVGLRLDLHLPLAVDTLYRGKGLSLF